MVAWRAVQSCKGVSPAYQLAAPSRLHRAGCPIQSRPQLVLFLSLFVLPHFSPQPSTSTFPSPFFLLPIFNSRSSNFAFLTSSSISKMVVATIKYAPLLISQSHPPLPSSLPRPPPPPLAVSARWLTPILSPGVSWLGTVRWERPVCSSPTQPTSSLRNMSPPSLTTTP